MAKCKFDCDNSFPKQNWRCTVHKCEYTTGAVFPGAASRPWPGPDSRCPRGLEEDWRAQREAKATGRTMITAADQASASSPEPFSPEPTSSEQGGR